MLADANSGRGYRFGRASGQPDGRRFQLRGQAFGGALQPASFLLARDQARHIGKHQPQRSCVNE